MRTYLLTALVAVFSCTPVAAQMVCGDRDAIVTRLASEFLETETGEGIAADGSLIELFSSKDGWTVLATKPGGPTCIVAVGQKGLGWQRVEPEKDRET